MSVVGRSGELTKGLCAEMHTSDAALGSVGRWLLLHQTLMSASDVPSTVACAGERASDALVVLRQTRGVSVRWWWRQQSAEAAKVMGSIRR
jgi:hypothetical protein